MLCFFELWCVQESTKILSIYWLHNEKLITLVWGVRACLPWGKHTLTHVQHLIWILQTGAIISRDWGSLSWEGRKGMLCISGLVMVQAHSSSQWDLWYLSVEFQPLTESKWYEWLKTTLTNTPKRVRSFVELCCKRHVQYKFITTLNWNYRRMNNATNLIEDNKMRNIKPKTSTGINMSSS